MSTVDSTTRIMVTLTVMMVAVVEVLDMTIVNVAMPHMMGSLGATNDQITWVLTAYIVAAAICMPLTGFLSNQIGQKKLLLLNISGFCIASALCGAAVTLPQIIFFRVLQGCFGAALVPLSQAILRSVYPPEDYGKAMAIWGVGIMTGPILGPTLGGYITDVTSWRWIFYINVPVCILGFIFAKQFVTETPIKKSAVDWTGLLLMTLGIGGLQIFLDRGNEEDWFESYNMVVLFGFWLFMLGCFIYRGWRCEKNIVNIRLFANKNFAVASLLITVFGISLFGTMAIAPTMLEHLLGYSAKQAGFLMAPQALASAFTMMFVSQVINKTDARLLIGTGLFLAGTAAMIRGSYSLDINAWQFIWPSIMQGIGTGLFFVPLATLAFSTLSQDMDAEAAGLYSFCRSLGSSIGISIATTVLTQSSRGNWQQLGIHIQPFNQNFIDWLNVQGLSLNHPLAISVVSGTVEKQAMMLGYIHTYQLIGLISFALLPLLLLIDSPKKCE